MKNYSQRAERLLQLANALDSIICELKVEINKPKNDVATIKRNKKEAEIARLTNKLLSRQKK